MTLTDIGCGEFRKLVAERSAVDNANVLRSIAISEFRNSSGNYKIERLATLTTAVSDSAVILKSSWQRDSGFDAGSGSYLTLPSLRYKFVH